MLKVLVTGGAGFIGSHLAEELAGRGYHVVVLDDLSTGNLQNLESLRNKDHVDFVQGSVTDLPLLQRLTENATYVFHQAALARVPRSIEAPLEANEANATGTLTLLWAARQNRVSKVVYASSSSVYGDSTALPQTEDLPPNPLSPYAVTKLTGEYYCEVFRHIYGVPTVSLRYFNVYGPRQDPQSQYGTVIPAFIGRICQVLPPVIYGDGKQSRDFTFVEDVVQANILAAESNAEGVYNIGNGRGTTINQLAESILGLLQTSAAPVHEDPRPGDPRHTLADISRAKAFGYSPKWTLEAGLEKTVHYFQASSGRESED